MVTIPRVGFGYDVHRIVEGRELWLGGIRIEWSHGLEGHSDADVLLHAVCDALLGAAGLRDIGFHFPDNDGAYKNIDSKILLRRTVALIREKGFEIGNIDCTLCAEAPKINPHIAAMRAAMADVMQVDEAVIGLKATTSEQMGFVGRREGMAAYAVALIYSAQ